jgi:hypothetical protein
MYGFPMMLETKPRDVERIGVIVVMGLRFWTSADGTWLATNPAIA